MFMRKFKYLDKISSPKDLKKLNLNDLNKLADELRADLISSVIAKPIDL